MRDRKMSKKGRFLCIFLAIIGLSMMGSGIWLLFTLYESYQVVLGVFLYVLGWFTFGTGAIALPSRPRDF